MMSPVTSTSVATKGAEETAGSSPIRLGAPEIVWVRECFVLAFAEVCESRWMYGLWHVLLRTLAEPAVAGCER